ncbi:MAGa3780 family membrane protein [Mycoplasma sp. 327]
MLEAKNKLSKNNTINLIFGIFVGLTSLGFLILNILSYKEKDNFDNEIPTLYLVFKRFSSLFYFTYLSNFLLAATLISVALKPENEKAKQMFFISVVLITVTFLIYWTLISYRRETWENWVNAIKSLTTHAINPTLGFIGLFLIKKQIKITFKTILTAILILFGYFMFAFILYFATFNKIKENHGVIIYTFLDFKNPFFYKGNNKGIIIVLDILIFALGFVIPIALCAFWKAVYRIKYISRKNKNLQQSKCINISENK